LRRRREEEEDDEEEERGGLVYFSKLSSCRGVFPDLTTKRVTQ
jgi:hypothetical protein